MTSTPTAPTQAPTRKQPGAGDRKRQKGKLRWWHMVASGLVIAAAFIIYGAGWFPRYNEVMDSFWFWFDGSIERLKVLAALIPFAVAYVAYRVFRSDRWWKRAEWALNASVDPSPDKRHLGKRAITALGELNMAPKDDLALFNRICAQDRGNTLLLALGNDPESAQRKVTVAGSPREVREKIRQIIENQQQELFSSMDVHSVKDDNGGTTSEGGARP
ncbi:hypothetical protein RF644_17735 [Kocuria sp. CPCC 205258]|uniref:hypothetical protein n=1 Tax=Kocuria sp. CPCC 205258 TaxID=3073552 RepID=UPI0034D46337